MNKPDYSGGSILNLVSSIETAFGGRSGYAPLRLLSPKELKQVKNVVLIVVDGLGFEFLQKHGKNSSFFHFLRGKMTSVFPTSTSSAIPSFLTGLSPQEHGMLAWYMFLWEFGSVVIPLPYVLRLEKKVSLQEKIPIQNVFRLDWLTNRLKTKSFIIQHRDYFDSDFSSTCAGKAKRIGFKTRKDFFSSIQKAVGSGKQRKFVYAYYDKIDSLCHKFGTDSRQVVSHFRQLDRDFSSFLDSIEGTNTIVIVTADHGLIDVPKKKTIDLNDHPKLKEILATPLSGEHRFSFCSVRLGKEKAFVKYVKSRFGRSCDLFKSKELAKKGLFGRFTVHPHFYERIGDYTLLMKTGWGLNSVPDYEKPKHHISHHGGLSKQELWVPLIVAKK
ncbi:MAG: alkaline phosphatase family protein [Candidatus Micrarchaeota archaeon]